MTNEHPSRRVTSTQKAPHSSLASRVHKHLRKPYRQPTAERSVTAMAAADSRWKALGKPPIVLDAGCGTGESTDALAATHPDALVVGVDKSGHRLAKHVIAAENAIAIRANLVDFWRLAHLAAWRVQAHYLLYPNPWPKPTQVGRRWHAHPVFPSVLGLGGILELRTNWQVYADEFADALGLHGVQNVQACTYQPDLPVSPFEKKYARSGHALFQVRANLEE